MSFDNLTHNTVNLTSCENEIIIQFYFVQKEPGETSESMSLALEATKEKFDIGTITIITQEECLELPKANLKLHRNIFIFDDFSLENPAFNYIYTARTVYILGTRAMLTVLMEKVPVPDGIFHMYNLAMRGMVICVTGLTKDEKKEIKRLVNLMGANFMEHLMDCVTHLISNTVISVKYEMAAKYAVKVMHPDWVKNVWQKTQNTNVIIRASDEQFERYKLPVFFGLCITSTGLKKQERAALTSAIEDNGGRYSLSFNSSVNFLCMDNESIGSEKHKAAIKLKKVCLLPSWFIDSIKKGFALPFENYKLESLHMKASTPTKDNNITISKFNPDNTQLSVISRTTMFDKDISLNVTQSSATSRRALYPEPSLIQGGEYQKILSQINVKSAKAAGNILDGFNFYLSGFNNDEVQTLSRVLCIMGAAKLDFISEQVTHVIVGEEDSELFKELDAHQVEPKIVNLGWLKKVIDMKQLVDESAYEVERVMRKKTVAEKPSPASKRAMKSMSGTFKRPDVPKLQLDMRKKEEQDEEDNMVHQYLEQRAPESSECTQNDSEMVQFLTGKNIFIYGYDDPIHSAQIIEECEKLGATLVDESFKNQVDYIITSSGYISKLDHKIENYKHIVNDLWVEDAVERSTCVEVMFHHKPIVKMNTEEQPLKDEKFVVTNYKGNGRTYINLLVENLGGSYTEVLRRNDKPILISPSTEGKKFESAKSWDLAVLTVDWLAECLDKKRRVDETPFLVGGTNASSNNMRRDSIVPSSQEVNASSFANLDVFDPPIENFADEDLAGPSNLDVTPVRRMSSRLSVPTGSTPITPMLNVSRLVEGMPTPQRQITKAALLENQKKNVISPRKKLMQQIMETPSSKSRRIVDTSFSPRPELPECMLPLDRDYGIRPDSSPNTQSFHKRKLEALDKNYLPCMKKTKSDTPTPPTYRQRRFDFYKLNIPDYDSPDPRLEKTRLETQNLLDNNRFSRSTLNEASKFLNLEDDDSSEKTSLPQDNDKEEAFPEFRELEARTSNENFSKKKIVQPTTNFYRETQNVTLKSPGAPSMDSEKLVTWNASNQEKDEVKEVKNSVDVVGWKEVGENDAVQRIFEHGGLSDKDKSDYKRIIESLGGSMTADEIFTHLIVTKPQKSEKFLMAISRGSFVIQQDYIKQCAVERRFIAEDEYEFGNPKYSQSLLQIKADDRLLNAAYKWRRWIKKEFSDKFPHGAFSGIKFILGGAKIPQFSKIIRAGGGIIFDIDFKSVFNPVIIKREKIDYCLVENMKFIGKDKIDVLSSCGVKILCFNVINQYLMSETVPDPKKLG